MTDFDKQWARYEADAKRNGETPSLDGFQRVMAGTRAQLTYKDVALAMLKDNPNMAPEELDAKVNQIISNQQRMLSGGAQSKYQEGQTSKDKSGKPIVFKNGQWVYP
jgi:CTP:molybdopterin cytidylyltransferase MocA